MISSLTVIKLIYILGIVNVLTGLLIVLSCRCIPGARIAARLMDYPAYQRFFKYHCYIWWIFWPSVFAHAILVILFIGIPFG